MPNLMKCELGGLTVSGVTLPVVIATVDNMEFGTWGDFYTFASNMIGGLGGTTCAFTCFYNRYASPEVVSPKLNQLTRGTESYGDPVNGFGFTRYVGEYSGDVNCVGLGTNGIGDILYKGNHVFRTQPFSGTAPAGYPIKMLPIILFADQNDQIFYGGSIEGETIAYWSGGWGGLGLVDDCLPYTEIAPDVNQWYRVHEAGDVFYTPSVGDVIGDAVKNRIPVGGDPEDPYSKGGYAGEDEGGYGDYDYDGDPQPFGDVPSWLPDGMNTGFFTLYAPSESELQNLSSYLWSNNFDLDLFKRLFNNPMDLFLNLGVVPMPIPAGQQKEVGIGLISTGVYMTTAGKRYLHKDFGTKLIKRQFKAYLDYEPYIKADLMLPYIGMVPIDIDSIMGMNLNVQYTIDIFSGVCVAGVNKNVPGKSGWHCIGTYAGNAMQSYPLTGADYSSVFSGLIQTAGAIAAGAAAGGGAGAVAGGLSAASSAVVNEGKPMIQRGGALSSAAGFLITQQKPVLIFSIPYQCLPSLQISEIGFPAFTSDKEILPGYMVKKKLKEYSGFVKVSSIHLHNISMTDTELDELETILKGGVYL